MDGRKKIISNIIFFLGIVLIALAISLLVGLINFPPWAAAFLIFVGTKFFFDISHGILGKTKKYLFFEDYMRDTLVYFAVAAVCVAGVTAIQVYLGGTMWIPLLAAGLVFVWR